MDQPCSDEDLRECLKDLAKVNRVTFAHRKVMRWVRSFFRNGDPNRPLHLVDVGCGGGDLLRSIERWSIQAGLEMKLTGIDLNPACIRIAREFGPSQSRIEWRSGSFDSFPAGDEPVDLVVSSLFTHHLTDAQIVCFLRWMEKSAQKGWLISDLYRSRVSYVGFSMLASAARWHRFVRHDGPVSIRRGFLPRDWNTYLVAAEVPVDEVKIESHWPARVFVNRCRVRGSKP
ncbi:methyltransferase domain-containing protein [Silvibacterium acidisoli]|uniref:methyltransferase domain-containing protein n=1 Tax=Acidobacteriaceae bacterium ZG23-2 TaxID=2883246 RepID=UPI00406CF27A